MVTKNPELWIINGPLFRDTWAMSIWWIQVPASEALLLQHEGKILKDSGYHYKDQDTEPNMGEYSIDACEIF